MPTLDAIRLPDAPNTAIPDTATPNTTIPDPTGPAGASGRRPQDQARRATVPTFAHAVLALAAGYLAVGGWLGWGWDSVPPEALRLTARAYFPLFGAGGALGPLAVGWDVLPTAAQVPLLPLAWLWRPFATTGISAVVVSALFMAGAAGQLYRTAGALGARRRVAVPMAALFALHPAVVYAGATGSAQAASLFFLLLATHQLVRWYRGGSSNRLAAAGLALAGAGLCGPSALGAGVATAAAVAIVAYRRAGGPARARRETARADMLVIALPLLFVTAIRILIGAVAAGSWARELAFEVNSGLLPAVPGELSGSGTGSVRPVVRLAVQSAVLEPFAVVTLIGAVLAGCRRDTSTLAAETGRGVLGALALLGGGYALAVVVAALTTGGAWSLGPTLLVVPLTVLAATALTTTRSTASDLAGSRRRVSGWSAARRYRRDAAIAVMLLAALPIGAAGLLARGIAPTEAQALRAVFRPGAATDSEAAFPDRYDQDRALARWLDAQHLPAHSVLVDTATGFAVVLSSHHPRQFVAPAEARFDVLAADPARYRVRFVLARPRVAALPADRVNRAFPDLVGDPRLSLVRVAANPGDLPAWRVYGVR
ncbi:hypothetical protein [Frankia sp. R82]|uniref:hypothetical protein n=1 Tax=Frankia sp. R82 TaxID=2950553 RepID=UPI0020440290|nr:hypothetical protein [Frankia sp. R82]MCM3884945.1 hypothetical protein [Frankia sp. R82]